MTDPIEAVALVLYNAYRRRVKMQPVDHIGANNTGACNQCREDATAAIEALKALDWKPPEKPKLLADIS